MCVCLFIPLSVLVPVLLTLRLVGERQVPVASVPYKGRGPRHRWARGVTTVRTSSSVCCVKDGRLHRH